jgi:hypothetical protein
VAPASAPGASLTRFFVRTSGRFFVPTWRIDDAARKPSSRLAVAAGKPHIPPLPGHALTAASPASSYAMSADDLLMVATGHDPTNPL